MPASAGVPLSGVRRLDGQHVEFGSSSTRPEGTSTIPAASSTSTQYGAKFAHESDEDFEREPDADEFAFSGDGQRYESPLEVIVALNSRIAEHCTGEAREAAVRMSRNVLAEARRQIATGNPRWTSEQVRDLQTRVARAAASLRAEHVGVEVEGRSVASKGTSRERRSPASSRRRTAARKDADPLPPARREAGRSSDPQT